MITFLRILECSVHSGNIRFFYIMECMVFIAGRSVLLFPTSFLSRAGRRAGTPTGLRRLSLLLLPTSQPHFP